MKKKLEISRKLFLKQSSFALMGLGSINTITSHKAGKGANRSFASNNILRSVSYNVFNGCIGYKGINGNELPDEYNYDLVRKAREYGQISERIALQLSLYDPSIVNFSEAPEKSVVEKIAKLLGMNYAYFPSSNYKGSFPGAILTHYDILSFENRPFVGNDSKDLFTRHWGRAILRCPYNDQLIAVHSAHLWYRGDKEGVAVRLEEIKELLKSMDYDLKHSVSSVLLQGDLNHQPDSLEYQALDKGGTVDLFSKVGTDNGFTHNSINPQKRIDYIRAKGPIVNGMAKYQVLFEGCFKVDNDDPRSFGLSDHLPVLGEFNLV